MGDNQQTHFELLESIKNKTMEMQETIARIQEDSCKLQENLVKLSDAYLKIIEDIIY